MRPMRTEQWVNSGTPTRHDSLRNVRNAPGDGMRAVLGKKSRFAEEKEWEEICRLMDQAATKAYPHARENDSRWRMVNGKEKHGGHDKQCVDGDVRVEVVNGYSRDHDQYTTDIKVFHRDPSIKQHLHVVFDERGRKIVNEWRDDH
jgi:hypothetical protein